MIQPLVEGQGEVQALPVLLRRLLAELGVFDIEVATGIRQTRSQLLAEATFRRSLHVATARPQTCAVLVLADLDDDCARDHVPQMLGWAATEVPAIPCAVVFARREYEAWFLASLPSLRGFHDVRTNAEYAGDPEARRGAKEALRRLQSGRVRYEPVADQTALTSRFALDQAYRGTSSFRKLVSEVCRLTRALGREPVVPKEWETT